MTQKSRKPRRFPGQRQGETVALLEKATGLQTRMNIDGHLLVADEPVDQGGENTGPDPYGYLSAALASCTAMTLKIYADFKGLDLRSVRVSVRHRKIHARDCRDCESEKGRLDQFVRELVIEGELDEKQRQRMLQIADRCPVHRTLKSEIDIQTRLRQSGEKKSPK